MWVIFNTVEDKIAHELATNEELVAIVQKIANENDDDGYIVKGAYDAISYLSKYSANLKLYGKAEWDLYQLSHKDLVDKVLEQIKKDIEENDTSAIYDLFTQLKKEQLVNFLPESSW